MKTLPKPGAATTRAVIAVLLALGVAACDEAPPTGIGEQTVQLRTFNAVVNLNQQFPGDAIEVRVNDGVVPGGSALSQHAASAYATMPAGVHRFEARFPGDERAGGQANLFRFDARAAVVGGFDYTLFVIGVVPAGSLTVGAVAPLLVVDDPFPPAPVANGSGRNARIKVVNAAPYAAGTTTGTTLLIYLTPGGEPPPSSVSQLQSLAAVSYRRVSSSVELPSGEYVVTAARTNGRIIASTRLSLNAGAARTLAVVSDVATTSPGPANHRIITLVDRDF